MRFLKDDFAYTCIAMPFVQIHIPIVRSTVAKRTMAKAVAVFQRPLLFKTNALPTLNNMFRYYGLLGILLRIVQCKIKIYMVHWSTERHRTRSNTWLRTSAEYFGDRSGGVRARHVSVIMLSIRNDGTQVLR